VKLISFNEIKKQIEEESAKLWNNTHCGQEAMWAKSDIKDLENFQQFYTKEQVDGLVAELQTKLDDLNKDDSRIYDVAKDWEALTIEWVLGLLGVKESENR